MVNAGAWGEQSTISSRLNLFEILVVSNYDPESLTMDLFSLTGRTALVTGGTRGVGQQMAIAMAEAGADIILVQRDTNNLATKGKIETLGRKAIIYTAD